jgi:hypothetical protein
VSAHRPQAAHRRPEGVPVLGHAAFEKVAEHETGLAADHTEAGADIRGASGSADAADRWR